MERFVDESSYNFNTANTASQNYTHNELNKLRSEGVQIPTNLKTASKKLIDQYQLLSEISKLQMNEDSKRYQIKFQSNFILTFI